MPLHNTAKRIEEKYFWDSNEYILKDETVNIRFEELLQMTDGQVTTWINHMRSTILNIWDTYGTPPLAGKTEREMEEVFREMSGTPGKKISLYKAKSGSTVPYIDEMDGKSGNIVINDGNLGSCVNQFMPTMMKAKINYSSKVNDDGSFNGYAVYDLFVNDRFVNRMQKGCRRHFRRDSFYKYSASIPKNSLIGLVPAETGKQWIQSFHRDFIKFADYGFWLNRVEPSEEGELGTGYTSIDPSKFLKVSKVEILELFATGFIRENSLTNLCPSVKEIQGVFGLDIEAGIYDILEKELKDSEEYHIRFYNKSTRIFPLGFTAFKIGYIQVAVNFPPMIAKYFYEKYTDHCKTEGTLNVYDPSAGWGGRIAGAMTVMDDRVIHYIGTDPNTDNFIPELGVTRYEYLANFINQSLDAFGAEPHTFEVFQLGSEVIGQNKSFKKYKGKLDMVFTSPPYFSKEEYSDDPEQSCHKFPVYETWRDGFLKPTLTTAVEYLKPNRYLLWNIADVTYDNGTRYPLEQDSKHILESLGMKFVGIEKMAVQNMPGSNRVGADGKPLCKNFMRINGMWRKYEPVFVFYKP